MKAINEIEFGFSDAENYRRRENKDLFNTIFLRTDSLEKLCERNVCYLVGEKGTGKTAYAVYFSNTQYRDHIAIHRFIRETDYKKFIALKNDKKLMLSDYTDIWKVIIYMLVAASIYNTAENANFFTRYRKFKALKDAIEEYYGEAFSPEIPNALQFVENSKRAAELVAKHSGIEAKIGQEGGKQFQSNEAGFQTSLLYLEKRFEESLTSLQLSKNFLIFIDGIDIRPSTVPYSEYLDCVKGLANAVWSINNDFFPSIRDSKGRMRVVLLVRPDIFNSLGLQNRNTKLRDNSVILDWRTDYPSHRQSNIFELADRMFSAQQEEKYEVGAAWDHYFPFNAATVYESHAHFTSFVVFLRYSFYRPRDILTMLDILRDLYVSKSNTKRVFEYSDLFTPDFRRTYGDYLLGEIKDSLLFYYNDAEFEVFLKFFEYLDGTKKFTYEKYLEAYSNFSGFLSKQGRDLPEFMQSEEEFLQFLYDLNIICFIESADDERFIRWCFRERSPTNISPKVKTDMEYEIHYGLANALNTGKEIRRNSRPNKKVPEVTPSTTNIGKIKWFDIRKKFGFIVQPGLPIDIHFKLRDAKCAPGDLRNGLDVKYTLGKDKQGRICATEVEILSR